jgi:osmotically-inducible protein OsmY
MYASRLPHLLLLSTLLAAALAGCGSVANTVKSKPFDDQSEKRTMGEWLEDEGIETKAYVNVRQSDAAFDDSNIKVSSHRGYVLLTGQVPSEAMKEKAATVVRDVRNVRRIYNELQVGPTSAAMVRTSDTWITTKVKSNLLARSDISGNRVRVVTEQGIVYLMGLVSRAEAERVVDATAGVAGVQKVVQLFEYID